MASKHEISPPAVAAGDEGQTLSLPKSTQSTDQSFQTYDLVGPLNADKIRSFMQALRDDIGEVPSSLGLAKLYVCAPAHMDRKRLSGKAARTPFITVIVSGPRHFDAIHDCRNGQSSGAMVPPTLDGIESHLLKMHDCSLSDLVLVESLGHIRASLKILYDGRELLEKSEDKASGMMALVREATGWDISVYVPKNVLGASKSIYLGNPRYVFPVGWPLCEATTPQVTKRHRSSEAGPGSVPEKAVRAKKCEAPPALAVQEKKAEQATTAAIVAEKVVDATTKPSLVEAERIDWGGGRCGQKTTTTVAPPKPTDRGNHNSPAVWRDVWDGEARLGSILAREERPEGRGTSRVAR